MGGFVAIGLIALALITPQHPPSTSQPGPAHGRAGAELATWPEFGLDPQRSDATDAGTGITAANVGKLRDRRISLPGTIDSSPIYLGGATVRGATHDVFVVTSSYGRTFAIDADSGKTLWTYTPPGYSGWVGSAQITNSSPILDPSPQHRYVYAVSPDGVVHKLVLASGKEVRSALAGDHHSRPDQGEDGLGAERRRALRDRDHQRLHR